jgi:hypothetical protein
MVSTPGRQVLGDISMEDITPPSQSDFPLCPACTRALSPILALQCHRERLIICLQCGWEMHE